MDELRRTNTLTLEMQSYWGELRARVTDNPNRIKTSWRLKSYPRASASWIPHRYPLRIESFMGTPSHFRHTLVLSYWLLVLVTATLAAVPWFGGLSGSAFALY